MDLWVHVGSWSHCIDFFDIQKFISWLEIFEHVLQQFHLKNLETENTRDMMYFELEARLKQGSCVVTCILGNSVSHPLCRTAHSQPLFKLHISSILYLFQHGINSFFPVLVISLSYRL